MKREEDYRPTTLGLLVVPKRSTELTAMASGDPFSARDVALAGRTLTVNQFLP